MDQHTLLAVAKAETLAEEPGVIRKVCKEIKRKDLLHLAILLHDMGKGRKEDHCEVGKAIAEETAARLGCDEQETRTLVFLVHKHLLMSQTAFQRDPYDKKVLFALRQIGGDTGSPPQAVGPNCSRYLGGGAWRPEQVEGVLAHRTLSAGAAGGVG